MDPKNLTASIVPEKQNMFLNIFSTPLNLIRRLPQKSGRRGCKAVILASSIATSNLRPSAPRSDLFSEVTSRGAFQRKQQLPHQWNNNAASKTIIGRTTPST
jgi:hypothetical protein